jgi:cyclopropane fatty-acyl-phospholipid synthase-like methyltransferase
MKKIKKQNYTDLFYKEKAKECDPKDFWGQVKRTVGGKPISDEEISMIEEAVSNGLELNDSDVVLDIGCGNGALSALFFKRVKKLVGVDFSEYLISVAKGNFEKEPYFTFHFSDALKYVKGYTAKDEVTKVLCYGTFHYFNREDSKEIITVLFRDYPNLKIVYLGNLPDRDRAVKYYYEDIDYIDQLDDHNSPIGLWRTKEEMMCMAGSIGWQIKFHQMPVGYYSAHYRFDAIFIRG